MLAGVWEGTYESYDTGRVGDVYFALSDDGAQAAGEVAMVPRGATVDVRREGAGGWQWQGVERPQVLTIRFVRLPDEGAPGGGAGREIVGELDPYPDPDCGCTLQTTFRGEVGGDVINGTFASEAEHGGHTAEGTWYAARR
ncbi:hypothetical protein [Rubrivirga litoralis]|uniref:Lipocalin-like domain-containing protein n=1 Tax=Rubrivirga litoralis TaxID=3075598 RepID=A0ABU3BNH8_9BACT|nr:hypothetical protein [Rubrivirga sp. F394]MDT0630851.1 hypothetical protein [Rubrivirga sp. F394]